MEVTHGTQDAFSMLILTVLDDGYSHSMTDRETDRQLADRTH